MQCFIDFVGLRGCKQESPRSGYYINSLAGVSLAAMEGLATEEQVNYVGVWNDIQSRAALRLGSELLAAMNTHTRTESLFQDTRMGAITDPITGLPNVAQLQGIHLDFGHLRYATAFLSQIGIQAITAGDMNLLIYDLTSGVLLETIPVTLEIGYNLIPLNREYAGSATRRRLVIGYRGDQVPQLAKSAAWVFDPISEQYQGGTGGDCPPASGRGFGLGCFYGLVYGGFIPDPLQPVYRNVRNGGTFGLQLDFQIRCSASAFICTIRELFTNAWMKLLGAEIMLERITSTRINKFTTVKSEEAKGLLDVYEQQYREALDTALTNLTFPADICFPCNEQVRLDYSL